MKPVMLFPLALSFGAMIFIQISGDYGWKGRAFAFALFIGGLALVFIKSVHFLVPLGMQLALCFWYAFDRHVNG